MPGTYETSVRSYRFYRRDTSSGGTGPALTDASWIEFVFIDHGNNVNFLSQGVIISNDDGGNEIQFSFDGTTVDGDLLYGESQNFFACRRKKIYLRSAPGGGGEPYRVWAW